MAMKVSGATGGKKPNFVGANVGSSTDGASLKKTLSPKSAGKKMGKKA